MPLLERFGGLGFGAPYCDELANDQVLFIESLFPTLHGVHLLLVEILERVKGAVEVFGQHVLIEAATGQSTASIAASKVGVGAAGAVEVAARGYIEDAAADGEVDGHAVQAIVGEEVRRGEGAEDGGWWGAGQGLGSGGLEAEVDDEDEEGEEDEVDGGDGGGAGRVLARVGVGVDVGVDVDVGVSVGMEMSMDMRNMDTCVHVVVGACLRVGGGRRNGSWGLLALGGVHMQGGEEIAQAYRLPWFVWSEGLGLCLVDGP